MRLNASNVSFIDVSFGPESLKRDIEWPVVLWIALPILVPRLPALVAIDVHVGLMPVCVDEELQHFRMPRAVSSQQIVEMVQEVLK